MSPKPITIPAVPPDVIPAPGVPRGSDVDADRCRLCGRLVDPQTTVSHGLRGTHTCRDAAGTIPPYVDPRTDEERAVSDAYRAARRPRAGDR